MQKDAVWATVVPVSPERYGDGTGSLRRFDVASQKWESITLGSPTESLANPVVVRLDAVPDAVLRPLTVAGVESIGMVGEYNYARPSGARDQAARPDYWIRHRFPRWYGANDDAAQAFIRPQTAPTYDVPDVAAKGKQTGAFGLPKAICSNAEPQAAWKRFRCKPR